MNPGLLWSFAALNCPRIIGSPLYALRVPYKWEGLGLSAFGAVEGLNPNQ